MNDKHQKIWILNMLFVLGPTPNWFLAAGVHGSRGFGERTAGFLYRLRKESLVVLGKGYELTRKGWEQRQREWESHSKSQLQQRSLFGDLPECEWPPPSLTQQVLTSRSTAGVEHAKIVARLADKRNAFEFAVIADYWEENGYPDGALFRQMYWNTQTYERRVGFDYQLEKLPIIAAKNLSVEQELPF